ncbi:hypothetical protein [Vibrio metschnikovii]
MTTVNKARIKKLKDTLQAQLNAIQAKYSADHHDLNCDTMTNEDYEHYIALDQSIEFYREILCCNDDVVIVDNL